ncbi:MAG: response regulator transcription factor [Kineosporiaceae bacterium]|nr:response regulator transcription factor [Kineosporiaceae bacterium]
MPSRVLVVEDDATVAEVVRTYLEHAGFEIAQAMDGVTALSLAGRRTPDLVVLDLMLPGLSGLEVCARLRQSRPDLPVIMLTALGEESDRLLGLESGADDYLVKPFSPRELVLRVQSVLRRTTRTATAGQYAARRLLCGDLDVDLVARRLARNGKVLPLTNREFDLLAHLMSHPREAFTRERLMHEVWGWDFGDTSTVTVHVRRLREKVEPDPGAPSRLVTVWGVGYRWDGEVA